MKSPRLSYWKENGEPPLLERTIPSHFKEIASRFPDNEAVISLPQNSWLNYGRLAEEMDLLARGLLAFGVKKGDRVGIWSTNNLQWILLQLATARIGAILVNINPSYRISELAYALKQSQISTLFTIPSFRSGNYQEMLLELFPGLRNKQR
ncbi:MAG: AMP-binding protein, partial [Desulfobulbaceae bacterium]|nr:AMP-binding protein [Desulfobulbaceae bacterium]